MYKYICIYILVIHLITQVLMNVKRIYTIVLGMQSALTQMIATSVSANPAMMEMAHCAWVSV